MDKSIDDKLIRRAAQRASLYHFFLASSLSEYTSLHRLSEEELAQFLGCSLPALPKLALCKRPDAQLPSFRSEVERIAAYAGANSHRLGQLLRETKSIAALRGAPQHIADKGDGLLLAARDQSEGEDKKPQEPPDDVSGSNEE